MASLTGVCCPVNPLGAHPGHVAPVPTQVCGERNRFEKLMEYFRNEDTNIDFMVSGCWGWGSAGPRQGDPHHAVLGVPCPRGCQAAVLSSEHHIPKSSSATTMSPDHHVPKGC